VSASNDKFQVHVSRTLLGAVDVTVAGSVRPFVCVCLSHWCTAFYL